MTNRFDFDIPGTNEARTEFTLACGDVLYLLGANGTGKSSLISRLFNRYQANAKRISAHRQTWFQSNTLDMTPRSRDELESNIRVRDVQAQARYSEWNPASRAGMAIYDLIDADTMQERKIAALVRSGDNDAARIEAQNPSPIQVINELMRISNLHIEIGLEDRQKIVARKRGGSGYSVAELSDGERNAFLIAAEILTAKPGMLVLIDEPERHLHRSIISPLLKSLFDRRKDCVFIVSTHELMLPMDTPDASTLLVRSCVYEGKEARTWTVDLLPPGASIDEDLKNDILGSRRKIIFTEGTANSLDAPLYSLLFPEVSVVPKNGCREVEQAVRGLRASEEMHRIAAWGIVDNDQRSPKDIERLRALGVWALPYYSVESLYYHSAIIARVARRQAAFTGAVETTLMKTALTHALAAAIMQKHHLVTSAVLRSTRSKIMNSLPTRDEIAEGEAVKLEIDVPTLHSSESAKFDTLAGAADWDGLLGRYPLRESPAFDRVVDSIGLANRATYRAAVLKLLHDDPTAISDLRSLLGGLFEDVNTASYPSINTHRASQVA